MGEIIVHRHFQSKQYHSKIPASDTSKTKYKS